MKNILVLYHGSCPDGFAGAYAAWKKFGDSAHYTALYDRITPPQDIVGKEVYLIDFSYPKETLIAMQEMTKKFVVLDHHSGVKDDVEAVREHIYNNDKSGVGIAWEYFHNTEPLPRLLAYIQENDLWRFSLPNGKEVASYMGTVSFEFETFDLLVKKTDEEEGFADIVQKGKAYREYYEFVCKNIETNAEEVQLGEYRVLAVNAPRIFRSEIGHSLAKRKAPFGIVWYHKPGVWHFSLRGDGTVNVAEIAQKYGGNGHENSAGFIVPYGQPFPFTPVKK